MNLPASPRGRRGMIGALLIVALAVGVAGASLLPEVAQSVRKAVGLAPGQGTAAVRKDTTNGALQRSIKLTEEQIAAARIDLVEAQGATLARRLTVPGTIVP